jgi:hypothetical protein
MDAAIAQDLGQSIANFTMASLLLGFVVGYAASLLIHGIPDHWRK